MPTWNSLDAAECDRRAWACIRDWSARAGGKVVREGIDHGRLTRALLWDKVGRAIRRDRDPQGFEFEASLLARALGGAAAPSQIPDQAARGGVWPQISSGFKLAVDRRLRGRRVLYCPFPYSRHAQVLAALLDSAQALDVVVPRAYAARWPGALAWDGGGREQPDDASDRDFAREMMTTVTSSLAEQEVQLLDADRDALPAQLLEQVRTVRQAARELARLRPDAVLVPADNHAPFAEYVAVAQRAGIPSVMLQHGLDCERYYLDEAYASHIAAWGANRLQRYQRESQIQPQAMCVVGNPHYDARAGESAKADERTWLWVTRPHRPEKCYAPSRLPDEGMRILDALLVALERSPGCRLLIKPHPFDYADLYMKEIRKRNDVRAEVVQDTVANLLQRAGLVITEDSTAGMDAMLGACLLVHAHLADTPPVVPFVEYGAAVPAFSVSDLQAAPGLAMALTPDARRDLRAGQQRFLDDFAGPRDGQASRRFCEFVKDVMSRGRQS